MEEPDATVVARAQAGDAAAFEILVRRHFRAAYLVALARMNSAADAQDICQDAFVSAWVHIRDCRDPTRFAAWLLRIVRNTAHNRDEYLRVRSTEPLAAGENLSSDERSDAVALRGELRARLLHALAKLSPVQREVVLLHDVEGWKHAEIAGRLAVSELMSRRHLSDARKRLRDLLGDYQPGGPDD